MVTYIEAMDIVKKSEAFYVNYGEVQGYEYAMFNYRQATYEDFVEMNGFELRGLTFVKEKEWNMYPMLPKFFNLNENVGTQYKDFKDKDIRSVQYKEDGSLISFVVLPNGNAVPKTKMSFDNEQTALVNKWVESQPAGFLEAVKNYYMINGWTLYFELVSPKNKIVLKYPTTELRLLKGRDENGKILNKYTMEEIAYDLKIKHAHFFHDFLSLDDLLSLRETEENLEGWVVDFQDDSMVKIKTEWYVVEHRLRESLDKDNDIIKLILDDVIDDLLAELEGEEKAELEVKVGLVSHYYNHRLNQALKLRDEYYNVYNKDRKSFAIDNSKVQDFGSVMKNLEGDGLPSAIKERVIIENNKLEKARDFFERIAKEQEVEDYFVAKMVEA